jgi:hypothetical protein
MSDKDAFVGTWRIQATHELSVYPFTVSNTVNIGQPTGDDFPVVVRDPEGKDLGQYTAVCSSSSGTLTITGVASGTGTFDLAMRVIGLPPDRQHLTGEWTPTGSPITAGTWVGNEGGVPVPDDAEAARAQVTQMV